MNDKHKENITSKDNVSGNSPYSLEEKKGVKELSSNEIKDKFDNKSSIEKKTSKNKHSYFFKDRKSIKSVTPKKPLDKLSKSKYVLKNPKRNALKQKFKKAGKQLANQGFEQSSEPDSEQKNTAKSLKQTADSSFKNISKANRFISNRNRFEKSISKNKVDEIRFSGKLPKKNIAVSPVKTATKTVVKKAGFVGWIKNLLSLKFIFSGISFAVGGVAGMIGLIIMLVIVSFTLLLSGADEAERATAYGNAPVSGEALKVAIEINKHLMEKEGAKQEGSAGALANAQRESMFDVKAHNPSGGVAGIFQWSGWSNTINGSRITAEGSIKSGDESTLTLENELKLVSYELNGGYKKVKDYISKAKSPEDSADYWLVNYEGVALNDGQGNVKTTRQNAIAWYNYFKGGGEASSGSLEILEKLIGQKVGSGQCYALVNEGYAQTFGITLYGLNAKDIGSDNKSAFEAKGWQVIANPKASDLKKGAIICWGAGPVAGPASMNPYGHTGVIYDVSSDGKNFSTYEQNANNNQTVQKYGRTYESSITYVIIPPKK